jgi:hypothetical protein
MRSRSKRAYIRVEKGFFFNLPNMGKRDGKLFESVFCQFAKKSRMGKRDRKLLELL